MATSTLQIEKLLQVVISNNASDLHLHVGKQPTLRLHGRLRPLDTKVLDGDDTMALMKAIAPQRYQQEVEEEGSADFGFSFGDKGRFRVAIFKQRGNVSITLRLIPTKLMTFEELGLPPVVKTLLNRPRGIFLVTGPTGSGKTTTLATMINHINETLERHIVTVEDPIEYYHPHKRSMVNQREVGIDVPSFSEALRRVLRADPDVIMVGELRDLETMAAAIRAAETGHLVFGTLHTTSALGTINRLVDSFPTDQQEMIRVQLATSLLAVLSQQLCPRSDMPGRTAAFEFLYCTPATSNLIRKNETFRIESVIQTGRKWGMQLLDESLLGLYHQGIINLETLLEKANRPSEIEEKLSPEEKRELTKLHASMAGASEQ
ncbi:MAG TPA: type IV pilus twitching motility protein PilT [Phycisphaerae bacterium]|nr:type IV pilus twitching motility protein PilT [Phycisphaerae bacterium]HOI54993.1 type IV pilus twitching motility protein PilT [Phycisphaerae bacterium]